MRRLFIFVLFALIVVTWSGTVQADRPRMVMLVHALPDTPVDVYLDNQLLVRNLQPGSFVGPYAVESGRWYNIILTQSGVNPATPLVEYPVYISYDWGDVTLVAGLYNGQPGIKRFNLLLWPTLATDSRLGFVHAADFPPLDITIASIVSPNYSRNIPSFENGSETYFYPPSGETVITLSFSGSSAQVMEPMTLHLEPGKFYMFYVIGSATSGLHFLYKIFDVGVV